MRSVFAILLICSIYLVVYYRLMANFYAQQASGVKKSPFAVLCSVPPYRQLPDKGKKYVRRYWFALLILFTCLMLVTFLPNAVTVNSSLPR